MVGRNTIVAKPRQVSVWVLLCKPCMASLQDTHTVWTKIENHSSDNNLNIHYGTEGILPVNIHIGAEWCYERTDQQKQLARVPLPRGIKLGFHCVCLCVLPTRMCVQCTQVISEKWGKLQAWKNKQPCLRASRKRKWCLISLSVFWFLFNRKHWGERKLIGVYCIQLQCLVCALASCLASSLRQ